MRDIGERKLPISEHQLRCFTLPIDGRDFQRVLRGKAMVEDQPRHERAAGIDIGAARFPAHQHGACHVIKGARRSACIGLQYRSCGDALGEIEGAL